MWFDGDFGDLDMQRHGQHKHHCVGDVVGIQARQLVVDFVSVVVSSVKDVGLGQSGADTRETDFVVVQQQKFLPPVFERLQ